MSIAPKMLYPHDTLFYRQRHDKKARVTLRDITTYSASFFEQHRTIARVSERLLHDTDSYLLKRSEPCLLDGLVEESALFQSLVHSEHFFISSCVLMRCVVLLVGLLPADVDCGRLVHFGCQEHLDAAACEALDILLAAIPLTPQLTSAIDEARTAFENDPDEADFIFEKLAEKIDESSRLIEINNIYIRALSPTNAD